MTLQDLYRRQLGTCPAGKVFYNCNGWRGCCSIDPCNPGATCPDDGSHSASKISQAVPKTSAPASFRTSENPSDPTMTSGITVTTTVTTRPSPSSLANNPSASTHELVSVAVEDTPTISPHISSDITQNNVAQNRHNSLPTAAIVGGALGGFILISVIVRFLYYIHRKRTVKSYQAPTYPSPYMGSDMSQQLHCKYSVVVLQFRRLTAVALDKAWRTRSDQFARYRVQSDESQFGTPQLDSREIHPIRPPSRTQSQHAAELPASPLP